MYSEKNLQILEQHHISCSECSRIVSCLSFTSLIQFHEICKQKIAKISFAAHHGNLVVDHKQALWDEQNLLSFFLFLEALLVWGREGTAVRELDSFLHQSLFVDFPPCL
jgi:hypothetical protein